MARQLVKVRKHRDGTMTIFFASHSYYKTVDTRELTPIEKFNAVRWAILAEGYVFSEKIEKELRNLLGLATKRAKSETNFWAGLKKWWKNW
jgi:hypothetical protein